MTIRRSLLPAFLLLHTACSPDGSPPERVVVRDSASATVVQSLVDPSTPVCAVGSEPTLTIGVADGAPEYQLYRTFGAKRLSDGRIAVVNQGSQELRLYDAEGRFLSASGGEGDGPGEFRDAFVLLVLPGDTLWVGDYRPWSWEVFAPDGRWLRSATPMPAYLNPDAIGVLDDGRMVMGVESYLDAPVNRFAPQTLVALIHAPDGALLDTIGVFENGLRGRYDDVPNFIASPMFDSSARIEAGGSRVITGHSSAAELRVYEADDTLLLDRIIRWTAEVRPVIDSDVAAERDRVAAQFADADPGLRQRLLDPQIREDRPVAEHFPVFSSVEIGRDGRLWVRAYRTPPAGDEDQWLIFAPDGSLQCRVRTGRFEQMPDFGSDYILVMKRDELGVERIFQYPLGPPTAP